MRIDVISELSVRSHPGQDAAEFYVGPLHWGRICTPMCLNLRLTVRSFVLAARSLTGLLLGPAGLVTLSGHFCPRPPQFLAGLRS